MAAFCAAGLTSQWVRRMPDMRRRRLRRFITSHPTTTGTNKSIEAARDKVAKSVDDENSFEFQN
jgi:hypothetical protein